MPHRRVQRTVLLSITCASLLGCGAEPGADQSAAQYAETLKLSATAISSSNETPTLTADKAVDGNLGTRWASAFSDPQWIRLDLGSKKTFNRVVLNWEAAFSRSYDIQVSDDGASWSTLYSDSNGNGGVDDISLSGTGRYVRMYSRARGTEWGNSLHEFEVHAADGQPPSEQRLTKPGTAVSSSNETATLLANNAVDGSMGTRWSSVFADPQWIRVDLGATYNVTRIKLQWEAAYARDYDLQVSADGSAWTTIKAVSGENGGLDEHSGFSHSARYVRMYGKARGTSWGYSLWEFEVYGSGGTAPQCSTSADCNDNNVCTNDTCVSGSCQRANNTAPCASDNNSCTNDVCSAGSCTHPDNGSCSTAPTISSQFASGAGWTVRKQANATVTFNAPGGEDNASAKLMFPGNAALGPNDLAGPGSATEIVHNTGVHFGTYRTRLQLARCSPGEEVVNGIFVYSHGGDTNSNGITDNNEIDIEILCGEPHMILLSSWTDYSGDSSFRRWARGIDTRTGEYSEAIGAGVYGLGPVRGTVPGARQPGFPVDGQFYEMGFDWYPDRIRWFIVFDGVEVTLWDYRDKSLIPQNPASFMFNVWHAPTHWFSGGAADYPASNATMTIDWFKYWAAR